MDSFSPTFERDLDQEQFTKTAVIGQILAPNAITFFFFADEKFLWSNTVFKLINLI